MRVQDNFDAAVGLLAEHLVSVGRFAQRQPMGHDKARVDATLPNVIEQFRHITVNVRLPGFDRQPLVHHRAQWDFVCHAAVHSRDRHRAAFATTFDRLPQHMRPFGFHEQVGFHLVVDRFQRPVTVRFHPHRIDADVRPDAAAKRAADAAGVDVRYYTVIYELLDDVKKAMTGMLAPIYQDVTDGYAEVRETFKLPGNDVVAGLYVLDGKVLRNSRARVLRSGVVMHEGAISSLKRFKDDVREVQQGYECGMGLESFNDLQVGDQIEFLHREEVARG